MSAPLNDADVFGANPDPVITPPRARLTTDSKDAKRAKLEAQLAALNTPETVDEDGALVESGIEATVEEPGTDLVDPDAPVPWPHLTMEFYGDTLEVRSPSDQALAAFSLASGKYIPPQIQNNIIGLFVVKHLSEASYGRVNERMLDPDEPDYTAKTLGELMRKISEAGRKKLVPSEDASA